VQALSSLTGSKATLIVFIGNGCPTVRAYEERLIALQKTWRSHGIRVIAINANNSFLSPPDTFEEMIQRANHRNFNFPYLKDDDRAVAKSFGAICTPHAFVLNAKQKVVYDGRIDDSRVGDKITSRDLENAVADVVACRPSPSTAPLFCRFLKCPSLRNFAWRRASCFLPVPPGSANA
jgi:thiol-disulfide isomerase/thioredoxin